MVSPVALTKRKTPPEAPATVVTAFAPSSVTVVAESGDEAAGAHDAAGLGHAPGKRHQATLLAGPLVPEPRVPLLAKVRFPAVVRSRMSPPVVVTPASAPVIPTNGTLPDDQCGRIDEAEDAAGASRERGSPRSRRRR